MTTIAFKNGVMAADTAVTRGDNHAGIAYKIRSRADGAVAGASGALPDAIKFLDWFELNDGSPIEGLGADFEALVAYPDGQVTEYSGSTSLGNYVGRPCPGFGTLAIGSGWKAAAGAMAAGATAVEAVMIAAQIDVHTCGPFQCVEVKGWDQAGANRHASNRPLRPCNGVLLW